MPFFDIRYMLVWGMVIFVRVPVVVRPIMIDVIPRRHIVIFVWKNVVVFSFSDCVSD